MFVEFDHPIEFDITTRSEPNTGPIDDRKWTLRRNKTVKEYNFTRDIIDYPYITFKYGQNECISFAILPEKDLLTLNNKKTLSARLLKEFLILLDDKLVSFLVSGFGVQKEYLLEFLRHDLVETVLDFLDKETRNLIKRAHDQCLLDIETSLCRQCPDLSTFIDNLEESDIKMRILRTASEKFEQLFFQGTGDAAKFEVLQLLGTNCEESILSTQNVESLARILIYLDNKQLLKRMHEVFENDDQYQLKQKMSQMSEDLQKVILSAETVDGFEVLATNLDDEIDEIEIQSTNIGQNESLPGWKIFGDKE